MTENAKPTADALVKRYLELRAFCEAESEAFDKRMKPYKTAMTAIEGAAATLMRETQQTALKTEHGTCFPSHQISVRCADKTAFLDYVFKHEAREYLTAAVSKEAVKQHMDTNAGSPPPGIEVTNFIRINFRTAS